MLVQFSELEEAQNKLIEAEKIISLLRTELAEARNIAQCMVRWKMKKALADKYAIKEIVGAMIGTKITNNPREIATAVESGTITEFIDRGRMEFMAACDLGQNWKRMAEGPTLFCVDDEYGIHPPPIPEPRRG